MKKVLFITNIPSPYRIDFFNDWGESVDLTVIFEGRRAPGLRFNWNEEKAKFNAIYLTQGEMNEKRINAKIFQYIKKGRYDYVFFSNYAFFTELAALIKAKIIKLPYILEIDGAVFKEEGGLKKAIKRFIISGAKNYFSPNELTDQVLQSYGVERSKIIRYPFSSIRKSDIRKLPADKKEKSQLRKELGIQEEKVVICVGQFIHRKGVDLLIKAASRIPTDIGIYCIGGIPTEEYKQLVTKYSLNNIHFVGFQNNDTLKKYYDAADIFVLPTREDVWGLVVNEAMARGLPIITTDNCGAGLELVKGNGVIVHTESVNDLAKGINQCFADTDSLGKMAELSIEIIENYTIEKMAEKHTAYCIGT